MDFLKRIFGKKSKPSLGDGSMIEVNDMNIGERIKALTEYALVNDVTILAGAQDVIDAFKNESNDVKVIGFAKNFTKHLHDIDLSNGVLIDESIESEMLEYLALNFDVKILGGYRRKV